jgi:CMP-N-acetylneuraminic acid synthetase
MNSQVSNSVTAFLPCRQGSERVPRKNIRPFGRYKLGLLEVKLLQLLSCSAIQSIVLSTNDNDIIRYAESLGEPRLIIHRRSEKLARSETSTDELIKHARSVIGSGHILWTHVTSPFVGTLLYRQIIESYFDSMAKGFDSLMTATPIHGFIWNDRGPINYNRNIERWPRTQTLPPIYEINSAAFLASIEVYDKTKDRIGCHPFLYKLDRFTGHDIDWEEDFVAAEQLLSLGIVSV